MTIQSFSNTPSAQDDTMPIEMTATEFFRQFPTQDDAIDHIIACNRQGFVQVSENTLPAYTFNKQALPPRFIAYADWQPNTHSF